LRLTHTSDDIDCCPEIGTGIEFETETVYGLFVGGTIESYYSYMQDNANDFNLALRTMIDNNLTTMLTLDGRNKEIVCNYGKFGIGETTLAAWKTETYSVLTIGDTGVSLYGGVQANSPAIGLVVNAYYDVTNSRWEYQASNICATRIQTHADIASRTSFDFGVKGTANNEITWISWLAAGHAGTPKGEIVWKNPGDGVNDIVMTFDGDSNDGFFAWMEDEDYFQFSDDVRIASGEHLGVGIAPHATYPVAIHCSTDDLYIDDFVYGNDGHEGYIKVSNESERIGYIKVFTGFAG